MQAPRPTPAPIEVDAVVQERAPAPATSAFDAAARERALLAYADSVILGRPMPERQAPRPVPAPAPQRRAAAEGAEPEDAAPTFHITIGKLEVVAPRVAEKRPQRRRPAPRLSLQDYLDRRRVGRP
jgi:hypothetical protein